MQAFFFMVYDLLYLIWKIFEYNEKHYKKKKHHLKDVFTTYW